MELIFFAVAFVCGFAAYQVKLPPMVGFLVAGFILHMAGYKTTALLDQIAALGITNQRETGRPPRTSRSSSSTPGPPGR